MLFSRNELIENVRCRVFFVRRKFSQLSTHRAKFYLDLLSIKSGSSSENWITELLLKKFPAFLFFVYLFLVRAWKPVEIWIQENICLLLLRILSSRKVLRLLHSKPVRRPRQLNLKIKIKMTKYCENHSCQQPADKVCGRCRASSYCSKQCQVKAFSSHKKHCFELP